MLTLTTLASGSSGNCALLSDGETHVLIDAGISCRRICTALRGLGMEPADLAGVLITHEHTDHIAGVATLTKQLRVPVYTSPGTGRQLCYRIAALEDLLHPVSPGTAFSLGGLDIETFPTLHDAAEPMGFAVSSGGRKAAVVTDLGLVTEAVRAGPPWCWWRPTTTRSGSAPGPTPMPSRPASWGTGGTCPMRRGACWPAPLWRRGPGPWCWPTCPGRTTPLSTPLPP